MKLRARLVSTVIVVAVPLAIAMALVERARERDRGDAMLRARVLAEAEAMGREACEQHPRDFPDVSPLDEDDWLFGRMPPRPRRDGVRLYVLDAGLRPHRPDAPALPARVRADFLEDGEVEAWQAGPRGRVLRGLVRLPFESDACFAMLVERPMPRRPARAPLAPTVVIVLAVVGSMLLVAGPVVARIRRLTDAVNRGAPPTRDAEAKDELGELARAFAAREATIARQIDEIERREAALRTHLAATSHDLLLPITVLKGHLLELERSVGGGLDAESLRKALEESHYVEALVRNLSADARLRAESMVRTEVDLCALALRVEARHAPIAARAGISLETATPEVPVVVEGDPTLLEQLVSNLVHNAVRHGHAGGHVAVVLETSAGAFTLRVVDDNAGVTPELVARLGERGFRSDEARSRSPEGMGLGVHIVREVAARHDFTVTFARNEPDGLLATVGGRIC